MLGFSLYFLNFLTISYTARYLSNGVRLASMMGATSLSNLDSSSVKVLISYVLRSLLMNRVTLEGIFDKAFDSFKRERLSTSKVI